jgi:cell wall-associated NlpC family hydrolase
LSRIPTRLRALAITSLTATAVLTASSAGATLATDGATPADPSAAASSSAVVAAPTPAVVSAASVVVAFARSHLAAAYRPDASGPTSFDCSGLMWRVFHEAGLGTRVTSHSARAIYLAYRGRGLASRANPQVGDLIVWGRGSHVGVYIGHGYAISALVNGVRIHRVRAMVTPFTAYLHTHLAGLVKPAWQLRLASHLRSLRHTTRAVILRASAATSGAKLGTLRSGTRFVVLARRHDAAGRSWLEALTFTGRIGWVPISATAR